jgi:pimeloyl-ACP methyl ester carboxylesterase
MSPPERKLFLPGFGARADTYARGLPDGWDTLQPPLASTRGSLRSLRDWLVADLRGQPGRVVLAGHSMGAALAMLAAVSAPERVAGLVLIAPAGLPLTKPVHQSLRDGLRQVREGRHQPRDVLASLADLARAPRSSVRLIRGLRRLDLSRTMRTIGAARIPAIVIGCASDTLVPPSHTRAMARLLGAEYRELTSEGGHVWMFGDWPRLRRELS